MIKRLYIALSALMILFLCKTLLLDGASIRINAYNPRLVTAENNYIRGSIYDATGRTLAYTEVADDGTKTRVYPYKEIYAHVTGYSLRTKTCLELALNEKLLSSDHIADQLKFLFGGSPIQGNSAVLTIDGDLQEKAYALMNGHRGAVIVSEPKTGKILTLVSTPSFDPNTVSEDWDALVEREDSPLYSRAMQGQYPPGSTFKIITSLAAYRSGNLRDFMYECNGTTPLGETMLPCYGQTAHGLQKIDDAFANSCNTYFANLGLKVGGDAIRKSAESLYLNQRVDFILPQSVSKVVVTDEDGVQMVGETAIGQGKNEITPFSMNLIAQIVANEGMLYKPYILDHMISAKEETVEKTLPSLYNAKVLSQEEALFLKDLMAGVVERGTAYSLSSLPCKVYGKTGTAQVAGGDSIEPHSWFTGFTETENGDDIAVTVLVENASESYPAVPIVYDLLSYYYYR